MSMASLHDPVTWYGINYAGTQITQWNFQNKGKSSWTGTSFFVLEVPLCNLPPSIIYSVPRDRSCKGPIFLQRDFQSSFKKIKRPNHKGRSKIKPRTSSEHRKNAALRELELRPDIREHKQ